VETAALQCRVPRRASGFRFTWSWVLFLDGHSCTATQGKLFTCLSLCQTAYNFWYWPNGGDALWLEMWQGEWLELFLNSTSAHIMLCSTVCSTLQCYYTAVKIRIANNTADYKNNVKMIK